MAGKSRGASLSFISVEGRNEVVAAVVLGLFAVIAKESNLGFANPEAFRVRAKHEYRNNKKFFIYCNSIINPILDAMERELVRVRAGEN